MKVQNINRKRIVIVGWVLVMMGHLAETFGPALRRPTSITNSLPLRAHSLTTAYEWLSEARYDIRGYDCISWKDPTTMASTDPDNNDEESRFVVPIYPLGAVYLPCETTTNHTLNNVEPRNLQMAQDLLSSEGAPAIFCAVLSAGDTGKIANKGTLMRIVDAKEHVVEDRLVRIQLTCQAESIVEIDSIVNPEAFQREAKLRRTPEYLRGQVRVIHQDNTCTEGDLNNTYVETTSTMQDLLSKLVNDYNMIRTIYQLEIGGIDFPPRSLSKLGNAMPVWDLDSISSHQSYLWQALQDWQSVCYTIQGAKQSLLSMERNERMIEDACSKGGPLELPIHPADLSPLVRVEIEQLEVQAQSNFEALQLDPTLDFQALLSLPDDRSRIQWLAEVLSRERNRLEHVATEQSRRLRQ